MGSTPVGRAIFFREVAQLGRALGLGPRGRRFESCLPDHEVLNKYYPDGVILLLIVENDRIRTYDPLVPNQVLYQAELHSEFVM